MKVNLNLDRAVMLFASIVILGSVTLAVTVSHWWLALTAFAGLNMMQASLTGFCPVVWVFKKLGLRPGHVFQ